MKHTLLLEKDSISASYSWKHKRKWNSLSIKADADLSNIVSGSEEEFILNIIGATINTIKAPQLSMA